MTSISKALPGGVDVNHCPNVTAFQTFGWYRCRQHDAIELVSHLALGGNLDVGGGAARFWNRHALCLEAVEMKRNRALHLSLDLVTRISRWQCNRGGQAGTRRSQSRFARLRSGISWLQSSLLENTVQRPWRHIVAWFTRHGHETRLTPMFELPV